MYVYYIYLTYVLGTQICALYTAHIFYAYNNNNNICFINYHTYIIIIIIRPATYPTTHASLFIFNSCRARARARSNYTCARTRGPFLLHLLISNFAFSWYIYIYIIFFTINYVTKIVFSLPLHFIIYIFLQRFRARLYLLYTYTHTHTHEHTTHIDICRHLHTA